MIKSAIAFACGCLLLVQLAELPSTGWLLALSLLLVVCLVCRKWPVAWFIIALLWSCLHAQLRLADRLPAALQGQDLQLSGQIVSVPHHQTHRSRFEFQPDAGWPVSRIRLNWYYPPTTQPRAGEYWQLTVRLKQPFGLANPGGFDYEGWLFREAIGATGYVRSNHSNQKLAEPSRYSLIRWRQAIAEQLDSLLPGQATVPLLQGLSVGLRDNMNDRHWQVLQKTGTSHLLAISGLHIGLAAVIGFYLGRGLWSLRSGNLLKLPAMHAGALSAIFSALSYALLAGLSIPTQRALLMITVLMLALLLRRSAFNLQTLALSMLLVLIIDPFAVLAAGFWLSYGAVLIIVYVSQNRLPVPRLQWLSIHLWIAIGLSPLLLLFFQQTSLLAPIANSIAVPVVSFLVVPLLLLALLVLPLSASLATPLLQLSQWLLQQLWRWLEWLADSPLADWQVTALPWWLIALLCLMTLLVLAPRGLPGRWLATSALLPLLLWQPARPGHGEFWLSMLDVGQGLSVVIHTRNHTLVYDTGPRYSNHFDTGAAAVVPYLHYRGVRQLDMLMISHGDNDHLGGAESVMAALPVAQLLTGTDDGLPGAQRCLAGQHWQWDSVQFRVLHPAADWQGKSNDMSCVLHIHSAYGSALLTGDIESAAERQLLRQLRTHLPAEVLQVPHHGSRSSSSAAFIEAVNPQLALVASGYRNRYAFPATEILQRYQQQAVTTAITAEQGAILLRYTAAGRSATQGWRQTARRLWTADATD